MNKLIIILPVCLVLISWNNYITDNAPAKTENISDTDSSLTDKIKRRIMKDNDISVETKRNIQIKVINGKVNLKGRTLTIEEKESIANIIREMNGVKSLDDQLMVNPVLDRKFDDKPMQKIGPNTELQETRGSTIKQPKQTPEIRGSLDQRFPRDFGIDDIKSNC